MSYKHDANNDYLMKMNGSTFYPDLHVFSVLSSSKKKRKIEEKDTKSIKRNGFYREIE